MDIKWDDKFEIGHPRIDAEHKIFLGLIHDLDRGVKDGDSRDRLRRIISEIQLYARFHFLSEENIMTDVGYPELASHRDEHRRLLGLLDDRVQVFVSDDTRSGAEIVDFVFEWFALHTTKVDRDISEYIRRASEQQAV